MTAFLPRTLAALTALTALATLAAPTQATPIGTALGKSTTNDFAAFDRGETNICQGCDFRDYRFPPAPINEPDFYHNSRLRSSLFSGGSLSGLDLTGSYFTCADLSDADLSEANLTNTDFIFADLRGANLSGADLSHATFRGALIDETTNLTGVTYSNNTIAPNSNFALRNSESMADVLPIVFDNRNNCPGRER